MSGIQQTLLGGSPAGYQIERSLRFNSADSAYLNRTPASAGNQQIHTFSGWVKYSTSSSDRQIISFGNSLTYQIVFGGSGKELAAGSQQLGVSNPWFVSTTQVFRDPSAWYHIVVAVDTTQATSSNRVKIYVNGTQVTAFGTANYPTQNYNTGANTTTSHSIGRREDASQYFDGYLTEINFIDGQSLTPSSFGQSDPNTGVWSPIKYTGTYGTNGFYLNFSDNSNTTSTTLGKDYSGNGNNWTPNNFSVTAGAGNDSLVDSPTSYGTDTGVGGEVRGNYCTLNPLNQTGLTFTNGNLNVTGTAPCGTKGTIGVSSGKWYWETVFTATAVVSSGIGLTNASNSTAVGVDTNSWGILSNGNKYYNGSSTSYGSAISLNDVIGIAVDLDAGKVWWSLNGTFQASGNPAAGTNEAFSSISGTIFPMVAAAGTNYTCNYNFGQRAFAYTAPSGFKALCTQNLPTPTIGATSTTQANDYFDVSLYTGTGSSLSITGLQFQPDWVWIKGRSGATDHGLYDAVRGVQKQLESNNTGAETTETTGLTAFNSDGFTVGALAQLNTNTATYVGWNWKANGAGSSNTQGSITSTVSANTTAGFSIVTYTGNATANQTVGHGLGVAVDFLIIKSRSSNPSPGWIVWHRSVCSGNGKALALEETNAIQGPFATPMWDSSNTTTQSSTTTFTIGANTTINTNSGTYVAYCFAAVAGYSAFGSYTGNGSTNGPFIYTGFRPALIMMKASGATGAWTIFDSKRNPSNGATFVLQPNSSSAEGTFTSSEAPDLLSNGFRLNFSYADYNSNGVAYIYAAFAETAFKWALGR